MNMPHSAMTDLNVGDGWVAVAVLEEDLRLFRIDGSERRRLPVVDDLSFHSSPHGLEIMAGTVYTRAPFTNKPTHIVRFDIAALPMLEEGAP